MLMTYLILQHYSPVMTKNYLPRNQRSASASTISKNVLIRNIKVILLAFTLLGLTELA